MTDSDDRAWWVYTSAGVEGPFTSTDMLEAINAGRVMATSQVCFGSQGAWVTAASAFPAAFPAVAPPPPPLSSPLSPPPPPTAVYAPAPPPNLGARVDVGMSVFLSLITFEIWWLIWLYPRLAWYSAQSGRPIGNRVTYFWLFVGLSIGGLVSVLIVPLLWFPIYIAAVVFGCLLTVEVVRDQTAIATRLGWGGSMPGTVTTLVVLNAIAGAAALTIVLLPLTIVLLVFYFLFFFRNHNLIAGLVEQAEQPHH